MLRLKTALLFSFLYSRQDQGIPSSLHHNNNNPLSLGSYTRMLSGAKPATPTYATGRESYHLTWFSHRERWYYPVNGNWWNRKASQKETRYYHTTRQCMMAWFPYFDLDYVEIPDDVTATLCDSHKNYLLSELGLVVGTQVQTRCQNVRRIQVRRNYNEAIITIWKRYT